MKGKFLFFAIALFLFVSLPVSMVAQDTQPAVPATTGFQRYEAFGGIVYSSANQVKGSSALYGFNAGLDAKLKPWFGAEADFGQYSGSTTTITPTVTTFLAGPSLYLPSDRFIGFFHVLFGGAHTGGVGALPDVSFASAVGGGFEYEAHKNLWLRLSGDGIYSSFVLAPSTAGYSANLRVNPRASLGVSYHF